MFDLAINTTLESKTLAAQLSLLLCADFPCPGNGGCAIFACFREGVSELCSLVYSGGLSRDLSVFFVEIKDPNKSFQKEIKIVIFLWFMLGAFSPVNRKRRSSFRCLTI
ncbi:hypothetical protein GQ457_06G012590 [Hibiscus cannabinus]